MTATGSDGIERLLVTGKFEAVKPIWLGTGSYANWVESREHPHNPEWKTWLVTVFGEDYERFVAMAQACGGVTVEVIEGAGETETYRLVLGKEGTGWQGR